MSKPEERPAGVADAAGSQQRGPPRVARAVNGCVGGKMVSAMPNFGTVNTNKRY